MASNLVLVMVHCSMRAKIGFRCSRRARRRGVGLVVDPALLADHLAHRRPDRGLRDEVDVGVGVGLPALALAGSSPAGRRRRRCPRAAPRRRTCRPGTAGTRACVPVRSSRCWSRSLTRHRFSTASCIGASTFWPRPVRVALVQRGDDAQRQVQAGAAVADLRAGDHRRAVVEAGGGGRRRRRTGRRSRRPCSPRTGPGRSP